MKGERGRERGIGLGRERRWVQVFRNSWSSNEKKKRRGVGGWRTETGRWRRRVRENEGVYEKTRLIFPERRAE